ncbi:MAG: QueT transporter family protein [Clostridia bacterium]|nr:QueT transporter family protein [Clostridia bacterium]
MLSTSKICRAGIIASVYFVLTYFLQAIAFGPIQLRVSEALTVLPLLFVEAVPALFVGCFLANALFGLAVYDLTIGSFATLISAVITYFVGKTVKNKHLKFVLGAIPPIAVNAFLIPLVIWLSGATEFAYFIQVAFIGAGQFLAVFLVGGAVYYPLINMKERNPSSTIFK